MHGVESTTIVWKDQPPSNIEPENGWLDFGFRLIS